MFSLRGTIVCGAHMLSWYCLTVGLGSDSCRYLDTWSQHSGKRIVCWFDWFILWWCYCILCKMAQVALIQQTHAGGPCLSPPHNDPQFPGQFSGGSPYPYWFCGLPEDRPSSIKTRSSLTCSSLMVECVTVSYISTVNAWIHVHKHKHRQIHEPPLCAFTLLINWCLRC